MRRSGQRAADGRNRRPDERLATGAGRARRYPRGARDGVDGPGRGRALPAHARAGGGGIGQRNRPRRRRRGSRHRRGERPSAHPFHAPRGDARAVPARERRDRRVDDRARHLDRRRDAGGGDGAGDAGGVLLRRAKANFAGELGRGGDGGASVGPGRGHRRLGRGVRVHPRLFPRVRRRSEGEGVVRSEGGVNCKRCDDGDKDPRARRVESPRRRCRPGGGSYPATRVRAGCGDSSRGR